jgi:hypothetical protein
MDLSTQEKIARHMRFWNREDTGRVLVSVTVAGDFFFSRHYEAARHLLVPGTVITPDMLDVDTFMADYERMYQESLEVEQDGFWVGTPFTGIPWMEAMLGCEIVAMENSFVSRPTGATVETQGAVRLQHGHPWLEKFLEFTRALVTLSAGRFPVGEPIMRGPSDMLGALLGQEAMVYAILEHPEKCAALLHHVTEAFLQVMRQHNDLIEDFHGGRSMGFYNVWTPGPCIWYQEDLSALLSPTLFKHMLRPCGEMICAGYDYTAIHLHPSSFFIVDELLQIDKLRAIEVNKDVGGPSVPEMMSLLQKIAERKNLILWGDLTEDDLACIQQHLPTSGVYLHIVAESVSRANHLLRTLPGRQ